MNFGLGATHSVILMSVRRHAPYRDLVEEGGTVLIYEKATMSLAAADAQIRQLWTSRNVNRTIRLIFMPVFSLCTTRREHAVAG